MSKEFHERFHLLPVPDSLKGKLLNQEKEPINYIENLNKVNIFIGENNSGKSYLMRELIKQPIFKFYIYDTVFKIVNEKFLTLKNEIEKLKPIEDKINYHNISMSQIYGNKSLYYNNIIDYLNSIENNIIYNYYTLIDRIEGLKTENKDKIDKIPNNDPYNQNETAHFINEMIRKLEQFASFLDDETSFHRDNDIDKIEKIYIHNIRTIYRGEDLREKILISINNMFGYDSPPNQTSSTHEIDNKNNIHFLAGLEIQNNLHDLLTDDNNKKERYLEFEKFVSRRFFQGRKIAISPGKNLSNDIKIKIENEPDFEILKLGTGLQMMIILTFPLFQYNNGQIFIEEPELFIHPSLLKQLIDIYSGEDNKNFQIFISTHSNHVIDTTLISDKISLFTVQKFIDLKVDGDDKTKFILKSIPFGDKSPLNLLGVSPSSVTLSNCVIWVEGYSDYLYFNKYFEKYQSYKNKENPVEYPNIFKEGIHFSFLFTGGGSIFNLDFDDDQLLSEIKDKPTINFITGKSFVIVDKANKKNQKYINFLKVQLGERFYELKCIEVENLLSIEVILKTIKEYDTLKDLDETSINSKLKDLKLKIKTTKIGTFIDKNILNNVFIGDKRFSANKDNPDNSTISNKVDFAEKAVIHINYDNMSKESLEICKNLYNFIKSQNNI